MFKEVDKKVFEHLVEKSEGKYRKLEKDVKRLKFLVQSYRSVAIKYCRRYHESNPDVGRGPVTGRMLEEIVDKEAGGPP